MDEGIVPQAREVGAPLGQELDHGQDAAFPVVAAERGAEGLGRRASEPNQVEDQNGGEKGQKKMNHASEIYPALTDPSRFS